MTKEDREIARLALAERTKRKHPKRLPPRWFDRTDIEMVARCTAAVDGDWEAKLRAHREALDGAFAASKDGAPTARFVWGKLEHFFEHVERGERRARAAASEAQRRAANQGTTPGREAGARAGAGPALTSPSRQELAETRAEFEKLAATAAPPFRAHLESMAARYREFERRAQ